MQNQEIENQTDFLFSAALSKCGNPEDAHDLTQDTLLAALTYLAKGNSIHDIRGWLLTVLNRKFYYKLRQKYKISIVSIGEETEITDETDYFEAIEKSDEAESLRRAVVYLSKLHREVIVRYYMNGDSVEKVARELGVPQGTVKSRLSAGRKILKKELDNMENYTKQSYEPVRMHIWNSGMHGINGEPYSLIAGDLIAQNLLYLAYAEPITETDLAKAIGIPAAYVEPIIKRLADGELMRRIGDKVYTDFIITTPTDQKKHIPAQKQFFSKNNELFSRAIKNALEKIRNIDFYSRFTVNQRNALELYAMFSCLDKGVYRAFSKVYDAVQIFPDRPNGGKWIAVGNVNSPNNRDNENELSYGYAGERGAFLNNYMGNKSVYYHVYDPECFGGKRYFNCPNVNIDDDDMLKLLYVIHCGINPDETGFNTELLKSIPWLVECKILDYRDGKAIIDIPVLTHDEFNALYEVLNAAIKQLVDDLTEPLRDFLKDKKQEIPKHLKSVPLQKQYMGSHGIFTVAAIRHAIQSGIIHDGDYDNENQCPYPLIFVINK